VRPRQTIRRIYQRTYGRLGPQGRWRTNLAALAVVGLGTGLGWGSWAHLCDACPSIAQIYAFEPKEATRLYTADGSVLAELAVERRTPIDIQNLPRHVYEAFIAVEDKRFWKHGGIDARGTLRAFLGYVVPGYSAGGGSTITQQLAGNMFPVSVDRREISVRRKLREMRVSIALEGAYEKTEILEAYLNKINFDGIFGIQAAALHYFGKDASELNLAEATTLAALPVSPATYNPVRHPERAVRRRNMILELMAGQDMITRSEAEAAKSYPLELSVGADRGRVAPYFVEWVRQILYSRYGTDVYEKGYRVYTTLARLADGQPDAGERGRRADAIRAGDVHRARPHDGGCARVDRRPRFSGLRVQPRHSGDPPAGLRVQAVRVHGRDRGGHPGVRDHLRHADPDRQPGIRAILAQELRKRLQRSDDVAGRAP
jgi:penicillin-binding protein 1A